MIISNQVKYLGYLYEQLKYDEVIKLGTVTLPMTLEEKRYHDALYCYEYMASSYFEIGKFDSFILIMGDYEKLCLTYGEDRNKMAFYYLLSLLHFILKNYEESIEVAKQSIKYAYHLNNEELIVVNFMNISSQLLILKQHEKAQIAMNLAHYYKGKIVNPKKTIIRSYMGMLFYYATTKQEESFLTAKQEFVNLMNDSTHYRANLELVEAFLGLYRGNSEGIMLLERVYTYYYKQASIIHLNIVKYCVERFQLGSRFSYYEELNALLVEHEAKPVPTKNLRSIGSEFFFVDDLPVVSVKYPNVISQSVIEQHVEQAFQNDVDMYCLHWSLGIEQLEELFGQLFLDQLLFTLFETIYKSIFDYESEVIVRSKNEGEAIIQHISEEKFFQLLMKLEEQLQSVIVHSTIGNIEVPIHFGFIHSSQLPDEERHYAGLTAHADASLYYAKSHGQFYIYS